MKFDAHEVVPPQSRAARDMQLLRRPVMGFFLFLMMVHPCVAADADYLDVNLAAYHLNREHAAKKNLSEFNPGIGYERESGQGGVMVGVYQNSYRRMSTYALATYMPIGGEQISVGVAAGAVSGYETLIAPAFGVLLRLQFEQFGLNAFVVPPASMSGRKTTGFIGLQLRVKTDI